MKYGSDVENISTVKPEQVIMLYSYIFILLFHANDMFQYARRLLEFVTRAVTP